MVDRMTGNDRQNENGGPQSSLQGEKGGPPKYDRQKAVSGPIVAGPNSASMAGYMAKKEDRQKPISKERIKRLPVISVFSLIEIIERREAFLK